MKELELNQTLVVTEPKLNPNLCSTVTFTSEVHKVRVQFWFCDCKGLIQIEFWPVKTLRTC